MFFGLILSVTGIAFLAWAMMRLAILALPVGLGVAAFLWAAESAPGAFLGLLLGFIVAVAAWLAGRLLIASHLPFPVRLAVALLFAVPAGIAGHSLVSGLMRLGGAGSTAAGIVAGVGALIIAGAAITSLLPMITDRQGGDAATRAK